MHARVFAVAPRTAAHLVELDLVVRQLEEHDVADVGNVHALAERRRGHEHRNRARAEQLLDARALGARKARVVEADERRHLRHAFAQVAGERHRLLARGHVDDALLSLCDERRQVVAAIAQVALVDHVEVRAHGVVHHVPRHRKHAVDVAGDSLVRGCRKREHDRVAHLRDSASELRICGAMARARKADVVSLVNHDEADAAGSRELGGVAYKELRRCEHDVDRAIPQARKNLAALVRRAFSRERARVDPEGRERFVDVKRLVSDERAQRVDEQARRMVRERLACRMHLEGERLAAPRRHDGKHGVPRAKAREHHTLRFVQLAVADNRPHHRVLERVGVALCLLFP